MVSGVPNREFLNHWGLERDPFAESGWTYVPTAVHDRACGALADAIESQQRLIHMRGLPGVGKTLVLERALASCRSPRRRLARVASPIDGTALFAGLASALERRVTPAPNRVEAWRALADAARLCRIQEASLILAIDNLSNADETALHADLDRLTSVDLHPRARVTVIRVSNEWGNDLSCQGLTIDLVPPSRARGRRLSRDEIRSRRTRRAGVHAAVRSRDCMRIPWEFLERSTFSHPRACGSRRLETLGSSPKSSSTSSAQIE